MPHIIKYDFIGQFETFVADFRRVLTRLGASEETITVSSQIRNPTVKVHHALAYDRELADFAYELYKPDFESFGYDRESWMFDFDPVHGSV